MAKFKLGLDGDTINNTVIITGEINDRIYVENGKIEALCGNVVQNFVTVAKWLSGEKLIPPEEELTEITRKGRTNGSVV